MQADNNTSTTNHQSRPSTKDAAESSKAGIVVVGAGLAGWGVIDAIRAKDKEADITLVTADNGDRYHKPMLTMAISQNKTPSDLIRASGESAAQAAKVTLLARSQVTAIDAKNKQLTISHSQDSDAGDQTLAYSALVLAMGAHPAFPKCLPEDLVWHVNHIERFGQLQAKLSAGAQSVAIVGAGMVGTETAEDLLKAGHKITLMDLNEAPLAQLLPAEATRRIREAIGSQGITFLGGCQVIGVSQLDNGQLEVTYSSAADPENADNHASFIVDQVIASSGLVVDSRLPESAGIKFDRRSGIVVDERTLQTTQPDIYAIGDCMSIGGVPCRYVAPLRAQAATIADAILGLDHAGYRHKPPMIRLKNKAISVVVTGSPDSRADWHKASDTTDELVMEQHDSTGMVTATVTVKSP